MSVRATMLPTAGPLPRWVRFIRAGRRFALALCLLGVALTVASIVAQVAP